MGVPCSCPITCYCNIDNGFESVVLKSINVDDYEQKTPVESITLKNKDSEPTMLQSLVTGKVLTEGSVWYRAKETQDMVSTLPIFRGIEHCPIFNPNNPKHEAAIKLQKVYKSFRTRRKLADCAVLIEKSWWKLLDFAELKHSSISFFDLQKHETAISRWSRARTRAAKVGKGLSKNSKAQKLALQHWLEAIDPRHRYGHNLHFYYMNWLNSESKEPFFYWLDIGEGKDVNLIEKCSRLKLQQQCIKYLGPIERKAYEVAMENGKLFYKQTGELLNTTNEPKGCKWIFVLSTSKTLYVAKKKKGSFQHSSFLAGGATLAAGRIVAENGVLEAVWPHSGHYRPTPENFQDFISFLQENNVDLNGVKLDSIDDEEESIGKTEGVYTRSNSSKDNFTEQDHLEIKENEIEDSGSESSDKGNSGNEQTTSARTPQKPAILQIPSEHDLSNRLKSETKTPESNTSSFPLESPTHGYEHDENIPKESVFQRINSHKRTKSFQLGKQLSCTWSTGAGPRIGCLRDYPSGLQFRALEQVNLSPKSQCRLRVDFPFRALMPNGSSLCRSSSQPVDILRRNSVLQS